MILSVISAIFLCCVPQDLWKNRDPPSPLKLDEILAQNATGVCDSAASNGNAATIVHSNGSAHAAGDSACKALGFTDAHRAWNLRENAQVCDPMTCDPTTHVDHEAMTTQATDWPCSSSDC